MNVYIEPTDDQLRRFVEVQIAAIAKQRGIDVNGPFAADLVLRDPGLKSEWLNRHREFQEAAWALADEDAA